MSTKKIEKIAKEYQREMLRSALASLFWSVISKKKKTGGSMKDVAEKLSINKSVVSRWFSGSSPNWELNTVADISEALDLELRIVAIDRETGHIFGCAGEVTVPRVITTSGANVLTLNIDAAGKAHHEAGRRVRSSSTGDRVVA